MIGFWNDDEDAALQGLSAEAQVVYLRGIRRFADKNGIAGIARRINWASLCECAHFVPDIGSKKKPVMPTRDTIKHRLAELERAGLIIRRESLVFELPLAAQPQSVQMRTARGRHEDGTSKTAHPQALQGKGLDGTDGTMTAHADMVEDGHTPPYTIHHIQSINAHEGNPHLYAPESFQMYIGWQPSDEHIQMMPAYNVNPAMMTQESMADFYSYWIGEGCFKRQGQWEHALNLHLKKPPKKAFPAHPVARKAPAPENFREKNYSIGINADGSF